MIKKILIGLGCALALFLVFVATRPDTFHLERSITMAAPREVAFAQVNDFHAWQKWSPWEKLDPAMTRTYGATASGPGATYAWAGNKEVGEGRMTIQNSEVPSHITIKLEFLKPFAATNTTTFTFASEPQGTQVTWAMDGHNDFMAKGFHLFMDMDKLVGGDFERGLAAMKASAESSAKANPEAAIPPK